MRFAMTAVDQYLGVFEAFVGAGWVPLKLFTAPSSHELSKQQAVIAYAERNKAAIQLSRMTQRDLAELRDQGCEALIVASYPWKIPDWSPFLTYAINFHCSPLPHGRGAYPVTRAIVDRWDHWAVSCHQVTPQFDRGKILASEKFPLTDDECHDSLNLKIQMAAKRLATRVAGQFDQLWQQAIPQEAGSYWPKYRLAETVIDFHQPIEIILRRVRAFGAVECLAKIEDVWLLVKRATGWAEAHSHRPGTVVHVFNRSIVVAASDGYIALLDSALAPPYLALQLQAGAAVETKPARQNIVVIADQEKLAKVG
jgi:methionyl-tRNA formyltransferase